MFLELLAPMVLLAAPVQQTASHEAALPRLFEFVPTTSTTRFHQETTPLGQVNVEVHRELFVGAEAGVQPAAEVAVELLDGELVTATYQGIEAAWGGGYVVTYTFGESDFDQLKLSSFGDAISGSLRLGGEIYALGNVGGGQATWSRLDPGTMVQAEALQAGGLSAGGLAESFGGQLAATKSVSSRLDLLVVHTKAATLDEGGYDGVASLVNLSVHAVNQALGYGDSHGSVNLVGLYEDPTYVEAGAFGSLPDLVATGDGLLDDAHILREDLGADSVLLLFSGYGGLGYQNCWGDSTYSTLAFATAATSNLLSSNLLEQLIGFQLGAIDPGTTHACATPTYQFGYASSHYRTLLGPPGNQTLPMYSNPDILDPDGLPMGDAVTADAARRIGEFFPSVAALRSAKTDAHALHTTFLSDNGSAGNTFDLTPTTDISLSALDVNLMAPVGSAVTVELWTREGTWVGHDQSSAGWTLQDTKIVQSAGINTPTFVSFLYVDNVIFEADKTYGVMVLADSNVMRYTNGAQTYTDSYVRIDSGAGIAPGGFGAGTFADRIWNGVVYYTMAKGEHALETTLDGVVETFNGNMFDVEVLNDLVLNGLKVNTTAPAGTPVTVDVWYRVGGYAGYEQQPWDWTFVGSDSLATSAGKGLFTKVAVGDLKLAAGTTYGFYVRVSDGSSIVYTHGTSTYSNSDMVLTSGAGLGGENPFGQVAAGRTWNGALHYSPVTSGPHLVVPPLAFGLVKFELSGCTPGSKVLLSWSVAGGGPIPTPWGTGELSLPYVPFASPTAGPYGRGVTYGWVPAGLSGLPIWFQGLDVDSLTLTNGVATKIL